jgi:hypothetical protein
MSSGYPRPQASGPTIGVQNTLRNNGVIKPSTRAVDGLELATSRLEAQVEGSISATFAIVLCRVWTLLVRAATSQGLAGAGVAAVAEVPS